MSRIVAVVPAFDEEAAIGAVVAEIHASTRRSTSSSSTTARPTRPPRRPRRRGRRWSGSRSISGSGGRPDGLRYALEGDYDVAVRLDGDGQHDAGELGKLLEPLERGDADVVTGSRFRESDDAYRPPLARRLGITWFARLVSLLSGQRVTDTTSGFQALNRRGIALFARDYPSDYPEVEATVLLLKHKLRLVEVPVQMREREHGSSSITFLRSVYYAIKVTLALFVAMARRYAVPSEGCNGDAGTDLDRGGGRLADPDPDRARADPRAPPEGALRAAVARDRGGASRSSAWRGGLNTIAGWLGVSGYPPAILFAAAIMFVIAVLLHYSTVLSRLTDDNVLLAQEVALLRARLDALETPPAATGRRSDRGLSAKTSPRSGSSSQFAATPIR